MAGDASIGEEIGGVGENGIEATFGILGGYCVKEFKGVAMIEPDATVVVTVDEARRRRWNGCRIGSGGCGSGRRPFRRGFCELNSTVFMEDEGRGGNGGAMEV
jgi:hypothetical protein